MLHIIYSCKNEQFQFNNGQQYNDNNNEDQVYKGPYDDKENFQHNIKNCHIIVTTSIIFDIIY